MSDRIFSNHTFKEFPKNAEDQKRFKLLNRDRALKFGAPLIESMADNRDKTRMKHEWK